MELEKLRTMYQESSTSEKFNAMITGEVGSGKTTILATARRPILIDSFDPGGARSIRDAVREGYVIVDNRYEEEDAHKPVAFERWETEFRRRMKEGFFDGLGTYCIDSATTWAEAILNKILAKNGRPGGIPTLPDWQFQINAIRDLSKTFTSLPCDCILTAHIYTNTDPKTGRSSSQIGLSGQLRGKLPALFDELYVMVPQETSKGVAYKVLTRNDGFYKARTRLGSNGRFETYEEPNIKRLLAKAGLSTDDKDWQKA